MTPDPIDHDPRPRGGDGVDGPREPGVDWTRVVAMVLALIVVGIVALLLTG